MAVQKVSGWQRYKELKFTYILHETIGGDKDVEQDVKQGVEHDVEIVCNVQGAKSLKRSTDLEVRCGIFLRGPKMERQPNAS